MNKANDKDGWQGFLTLCTKAQSTEQLNELFHLFFTLEEKKDMANRYLIVQALLKGDKNQRDMAQDLGVSIAKITRGSNSLKTISEKLQSFLTETCL